MKRSLAAWVLLAILPLLGGCEGREGTPADPGPPFPGSARSLEELGARVLHALVVGDTLALEEVRLTEEEHNGVIWPELPAARPEANFPVEFAWQNIQMRNRRELGRILPWYSGRELRFSSVRCRGDVQRFPTFAVHTDCQVVFRDGELGLLAAQIFKDVVQRNGGYKIFRYYEEDPRPFSAGNGSDPPLLPSRPFPHSPLRFGEEARHL